MIFISHKLHEILAVSNKIAVLRRGEIVGKLETENAERGQLAELMVGRAVTRPKLEPMETGAPVLQISGLSTEGSGAASLKAIDLTINAHEIVGIAGVAGNGQSTLADTLSGLKRGFTGDILLEWPAARRG